MLINAEGLVFVGRRIDQTVEGWQMPQGGIDQGESPEQAALRELKEEIGTDKAKPLREMDGWIDYDLPQHLLGVALKVPRLIVPFKRDTYTKVIEAFRDLAFAT
jgi:putative (di)nucleoside polyphosphate hydrolase